MVRGNRARSSLVLCLLFTLAAKSQRFPARNGQGAFNPEDHGLPKEENDPAGWDEIFADEYKQMMEKENLGNNDEEDEPFSGKLEVVMEWPVKKLHLGQIGGLATDPEGYLHVFHRADRSWLQDSFDGNNTFTYRKDGPIKQPTVFTVNGTNGIVLNKWGENLFYLPHGFEIDHHGNMWMTDVAMHQVFKFEPGKHQPSMTLGKAFDPAKSNKDTERFCMPTDVAVATNGDFFVSDGYCASRILKFDKNGKLIGQFGLEDAQIPHSLALAEDLDLICVADREGMRTLCYNPGLVDPSKLGEPEREFTDELMGRVFGITYSQPDGLLYGVTGQTGILVSQGFSVDLREDERYKTDIISYWSPDDKGFDSPHDVTVTRDGENVYVGEIKPNNLWKFVKEDQ